MLLRPHGLHLRLWLEQILPPSAAKTMVTNGGWGNEGSYHCLGQGKDPVPATGRALKQEWTSLQTSPNRCRPVATTGTGGKDLGDEEQVQQGTNRRSNSGLEPTPPDEGKLMGCPTIAIEKDTQEGFPRGCSGKAQQLVPATKETSTLLLVHASS